jgi:hypothetical protein
MAPLNRSDPCYFAILQHFPRANKVNYLEKQAEAIGSEFNDLFIMCLLLIEFGTPLSERGLRY